ncbi:flagellin [Mammaliicoccus sciuri]
MIINHNIAALNTHRQLGANNTQASKNLEKLSSGLQINRAGDDAAGLAISEKMRGQIRGLDMAQKNAQDGISLIQTAEGALNETHDILQRMRELAVQSSNDTNNDADRGELQKELDQLASEITRIADNTEFNTKNLLGKDGFDGKFHIGANKGQDISLKINDMSADTLKVVGEYTAADATDVTLVKSDGTDLTESLSVLTDGEGKTVAAFIGDGYYKISDLELNADEDAIQVKDGAVAFHTAAAAETADDKVEVGGINISSQASASKAIDTINNAIETVSAERSKLGAVQNRLEHTINNLGTSSENLTAAESRIRDVDYVLAA